MPRSDNLSLSGFFYRKPSVDERGPEAPVGRAGHPRLSIARRCALVSIKGSRQMTRHLRRRSHEVDRKRVRGLMHLMDLTPIYEKPRTSDPHRSTRPTPTCCETSQSNGRITSGAPT